MEGHPTGLHGQGLGLENIIFTYILLARILRETGKGSPNLFLGRKKN